MALTFELREGDVIPEEILLSKMSGQFYVEHLKFINSVKIIITDKEPFRKNFLNDH